MVGDGGTIRIWKDKRLLGDLLNSDQDNEKEETVNMLIDPTSKQWDIEKLKNAIPPQAAIQACQIPISYTGISDKFLWPYTKDAQYSVKTGYHIAHEDLSIDKEASSSHQQFPASFWHSMWNIKAPQKIKMFLWLMCNNALPVNDNLYKRKMINSPICKICNMHKETIEHALFLCPWTSLVW